MQPSISYLSMRFRPKQAAKRIAAEDLSRDWDAFAQQVEDTINGPRSEKDYPPHVDSAFLSQKILEVRELCDHAQRGTRILKARNATDTEVVKASTGTNERLVALLNELLADCRLEPAHEN